VNQATAVQLVECGGQTGANAQCLADVHRRADPSNEQFATEILEDECGPPLAGRQRKGPNRPRGIQFVPQRVFVLQHPDDLWSRMLRPRCHDEGRTQRPGCVRRLAVATKDEVTILEQSFEGAD
jgi:hypothetical protein